MAFTFNPNTDAIAETLTKTAAGKAAQAAAQAMSPKLVRDVQRVLQVGGTLGNLLGVTTGVDIIDNLFALGNVQDKHSPLLGGLTLRQVKAMHSQLRSARVAKKNLFFLRLHDRTPPKQFYAKGGTTTDTYASRIGASVGSFIGGSVGGYLGGIVGSAIAGPPVGDSVGAAAVASFDLLALDVSYGSSIQGDHTQIGSTFYDRPMGSSPSELQIVTMDDEAGTLKRWFSAKMDQCTHPDGTFGLPEEYLVDIEIVHAIPSGVPQEMLAYSKTLSLRPANINIEHSRRDQAVAELQITFTQFDQFAGAK